MSATASTNAACEFFADPPPGAAAPEATMVFSIRLVKLKRFASSLITVMDGSFRMKRLTSTSFLNSGISFKLTRMSLAWTKGSLATAGSSPTTTSATRTPMPGHSDTPTSPMEMSRPVTCLACASKSPFLLLMILSRLAATTATTTITSATTIPAAMRTFFFIRDSRSKDAEKLPGVPSNHKHRVAIAIEAVLARHRLLI